MGDQLSDNPEALRLFFTEDLYLVQEAVGVEQSPPSLSDRPEQGQISAIAPDKAISPISAEGAPTGMQEDYVYLGKNARNILILVNDPDNEVSSEEGRELLKKIVKAINLTGSDFALLNYAAYADRKFTHLQAFFSTKLMFAFGVDPKELGLPDLIVNSVHNHEGVQLVFSANLKHMGQNDKVALWSCLKQMTI